MRIIIAGAGELGRLLASTLSNAAHDVTIIDSDADMLEHINDNLDIKVQIQNHFADDSKLLCIFLSKVSTVRFYDVK